MHPSYMDLRDDFIAEANPKFKAASLGKLSEALLKHIQEYPDVFSTAAPQAPREVESNPSKEDL